MKNEQSFRSILIGALVRLIGMTLIGLLFLMIHTCLIDSGRMSIKLNLSAVIHFVSVGIIGVVGGLLSKHNNTKPTLIAFGLYYIVIIFLSGVVLNTLSEKIIGTIIGGTVGLTASLFISISNKNKASRWSRKKFHC